VEAEKHPFIEAFDKTTSQARKLVIESLINGTTSNTHYIVAIVIPSELSEEEKAKRTEEELKTISHVKKVILSTAGNPLGLYTLIDKVKERLIQDTPQIAMLERLKRLESMMSGDNNPFAVLSAMSMLRDMLGNDDDDAGTETKEPAEVAE